MAVVFAGAPLVYLASEKDLDYETSLYDAVSEVVELALGQRTALRAAPETRLVSRLLYYYCMYCLNERSLGEEMMETIPVHITQGLTGPEPKLLSDTRRLALVGLHTFLPYAHERFLLDWSVGPSSRATNGRPSMRRPFGWLLDPLVEACRALSASEFLYWLRRVHILLFYFRGHFASFTMRAGGVRLVRSSKAHQPSARYSVLGALLSAELLSTTVFKVVHKWRCMRAQIDLEDAATASTTSDGAPSASASGATETIGAADASTKNEARNEQGLSGTREDPPRTDEMLREGRRRCVLCQGPIQQIAATECGHLFCWECIIGWSTSSTKAECPLCRQIVNPSKVLLLPWHDD